MLDLVYPLRRRNSNGHEELRYSLRSIEANLPHGRVWIVARERPKWVSECVELIRVSDNGTKWENIPAAIAAACDNAEVSERFVYLNDDFFVMEPIGEVPVLHKGLLEETRGYIKPHGTYGRGYVETGKLLRELGVERELLNYELHAPFPVVKDDMAEALRLAKGFKGKCLQARTLYGNLYEIGGEQMSDVKVHGPQRDHLDKPFLSTNEHSFARHPVGKHIRAAFPTPSRYERST